MVQNHTYQDHSILYGFYDKEPQKVSGYNILNLSRYSKKCSKIKRLFGWQPDLGKGLGKISWGRDLCFPQAIQRREAAETLIWKYWRPDELSEDFFSTSIERLSTVSNSCQATTIKAGLPLIWARVNKAELGPLNIYWF